MSDKKPRRRLVTLLLVLGGAVLLLLATPFVVGRFLSKDYHGNVTAVFAAPPAEVFVAFEDYRTTPITGSMWKGTEDRESENGLASWVEDMGSSQILVRTETAESPSKLVRRYEDSVVPMTARVELVLAPVDTGDGGTRVTGVNHFEVADGTWHVPFFRFILTLTNGANRSLTEYLTATGKALGEVPSFE